jgi:hypothetical protein
MSTGTYMLARRYTCVAIGGRRRASAEHFHQEFELATEMMRATQASMPIRQVGMLANRA